ncbi:hypothetical protein [Mycolicibacterium sediminis]|uniref:Uncharacterized protein n=1 Tax=Mycolicibacterium sediminis TaxID=1286180 RepID=A0A7I7QMA1_9MYCO|nr:hypothetical protein [Mycolicibacterium sediminis]BBY27412.1 hypothetical protein MSEDJ_15080 [Mycolicibacterium sediminis]
MTHAFAVHLADFASTGSCPHAWLLADRLRRPDRVAVLGRAGVGRRTVEAALRRAGVAVSGGDAEVAVVVIAEDAKAEDLALVRSADRPALFALTKADLAGSGAGGPLAVARRRAAAIQSRSAVPTVPVVGLLGALGPDSLDDDLVAALRAFAVHPPDMTGVDSFVDDPHRVGRDVRTRLLAVLDRFGIAHAILALDRGVDPSGLSDHLRRLGNVDEVSSALDAASARVGYGRVLDAVAELRSLTDTSVDAWLASDDTVLAVMAAAVDVVEADGLRVDRGDTAADHLERARLWRRYGRGPVSTLHHRCSVDIVRGSLRLLDGSAR